MTREGITVTVYEVSCKLCNQKIKSTSEADCKQQLSNHIDNECKVAATMQDWNRKGIYKEMMAFLRGQDLSRKLEKLVKKYGFEEVKTTLMSLESEEGEQP